MDLTKAQLKNTCFTNFLWDKATLPIKVLDQPLQENKKPTKQNKFKLIPWQNPAKTTSKTLNPHLAIKSHQCMYVTLWSHFPYRSWIGNVQETYFNLNPRQNEVLKFFLMEISTKTLFHQQLWKLTKLNCAFCQTLILTMKHNWRPMSDLLGR